MPSVTERDHIIRARWRSFLEPLVGVGRPHSIAAVARNVAEQLKLTGDGRADLYAYLSERQTCSAEKAFAIGSALYDLGEGWCSPPLALYAAGYFSEALRVIAGIAGYHDGRDAAVELAALIPVACSSDHMQPRARLLLTALHLPARFPARLRHVFNHENPFEDRQVSELATLASGSMPLSTLESIVETALFEWALEHANTAQQALLMPALIEHRISRLRSLQKHAEERGRLIASILDDTNLSDK